MKSQYALKMSVNQPAAVKALISILMIYYLWELCILKAYIIQFFKKTVNRFIVENCIHLPDSKNTVMYLLWTIYIWEQGLYLPHILSNLEKVLYTLYRHAYFGNDEWEMVAYVKGLLLRCSRANNKSMYCSIVS